MSGFVKGDFFCYLIVSTDSYQGAPDRQRESYRYGRIRTVNRDGIIMTFTDALKKTRTKSDERIEKTWGIPAEIMMADAFWAAICERKEEPFATFEEAKDWARRYGTLERRATYASNQLLEHPESEWPDIVATWSPEILDECGRALMAYGLPWPNRSDITGRIQALIGLRQRAITYNQSLSRVDAVKRVPKPAPPDAKPDIRKAATASSKADTNGAVEWAQPPLN